METSESIDEQLRHHKLMVDLINIVILIEFELRVQRQQDQQQRSHPEIHSNWHEKVFL